MDKEKQELDDKYFDTNKEAAKKSPHKAVTLYKNYCMGKDLTDEERKRRVNRFRCG